MESNMSILQKAENTVAELSSKSGFLKPEQADRFMLIPIKKSKLIGMIDVQGMNGPEKQIDKAQGLTGTSVFNRGTSGQALTDVQTQKVNLLDAVLLQSKLFRGLVSVQDEVFEDNIEGEALANTVRDMIATRATIDVENLVINGDTTSSNQFLATLDGVLKLITTNVVVAGGATLAKPLLRDIDLALPEEYRDEPEKLRYLTAYKAAACYRDSLGDRQTAAGDSALMNGFNGQMYAPYNGIPVVDIPYFPSNLGSGNDETVVVYGKPSDIILGYQRNIKIEPERKPGEGRTYFHVTARFDVKLRHEPAFVQSTGVSTTV